MQDMNDKFKAIFKVIEKFCFDREDPVKAIHNMRFFQEGYDAFGIDDDDLKPLRDRILEDFQISVLEIADLGKLLFKTGKYEFGTLAIMLIKKHRPRMDAYVYDAVKQWLDEGVENWAHADLLAIKIIPVFFELDLCNLESFESWRDSSGKWTRRAVVMSLNSIKQAIDAKALLEFITPMIQDNEKVVQQAIGIFLSDLWNKNNASVEDFLAEHKDQMDIATLKTATSPMPIAKARLFRKTLPRHQSHHKRNNPRHNKKAGAK
ncbi:MAG: DNA alkylation repair protein [Candidatus Cloacimonetes bacterium]|jgi:3-methyladenine DNA glycosylase AlkD|nr:DNA alkylation repair protein [Candidatus Cloacimonadota bacterium]MDY0337886.1 DNA alkylation repair protein [Candidatus Cloacimonadaceae bacterium]MDD2543599.1 DNA alkylation repair protein [Candidatus Cloacimonadota bacterium]MDD2684245.1 DNA alkylation repair protein [Candidatus Cloacimonadota bacterium]MDD3097795.1 DNA alkylation repair protein [Candidatus Cloacimonadota bacterium]